MYVPSQCTCCLHKYVTCVTLLEMFTLYINSGMCTGALFLPLEKLMLTLEYFTLYYLLPPLAQNLQIQPIFCFRRREKNKNTVWLSSISVSGLKGNAELTKPLDSIYNFVHIFVCMLLDIGFWRSKIEKKKLFHPST